MTLDELNTLSEAKAEALFMQCCTSQRWVTAMTLGRPYQSRSALQHNATKVWDGLTEPDFLQAFDGHPKIGDLNSLKKKYANTQNSASLEQSGMATATDEIIAKLATGNKLYESQFGFIFIVCATGKSAGEMCDLLYDRLSNDREKEIIIAAEEQKKILLIRLEKLL